MASSPLTTNIDNVSSSLVPVKLGFDPAYSPSENPTTFVQADPLTFRSVVQRLTGAPSDPATHKLPVTLPARVAGEMGPRRSGFKLHERRQSARKLEIKLNKGVGCPWVTARQMSFLGFGGEMVMASPVSTLDVFARGSPRTPMSPMAMEAEEKAIAAKGFYLHPSTPKGSEPELLALFPLQSPRGSSSSS